MRQCFREKRHESFNNWEPESFKEFSQGPCSNSLRNLVMGEHVSADFKDVPQWLEKSCSNTAVRPHIRHSIGQGLAIAEAKATADSTAAP